MKPVDTSQVSNYSEFVFNPLDLLTLEKFNSGQGGLPGVIGRPGRHGLSQDLGRLPALAQVLEGLSPGAGEPVFCGWMPTGQCATSGSCSAPCTPIPW